MEGMRNRLYDPFVGGKLDPTMWEPFSYETADGIWVAVDENAKVRVSDGETRVEVSPFSKHHDHIQFLDNEKLIYLSTNVFPVPAGKRWDFDVSMSAETLNSDPRDFFDAYVTFSVDDIEQGLIFNIATNGEQVKALYEYLPEEFCYFIEHPNRIEPPGAGEYMNCRISFGPEPERVRYFANDALLYELGSLPRPAEQVRVGMGIFSGIRLGPHGSQSNRGQGAVGCWREFRVPEVEVG